MTVIRTLLLLMATFAASTQAFADVLLPADSVSGYAQAGVAAPSLITTWGTASNGYVYGDGSQAFAVVTANPGSNPYVSASGYVLGSGNSYAVGYANYYYEIVGPANIDVPVLITASVFTQASGDANAHAKIEFTGLGGDPTSTSLLWACTDFVPCDGSGHTLLAPIGAVASIGNYSTTVRANATGVMQFIAQFGAGAGGSASATADPIIQIDPSFAQASQYTLVMNSDTAVPEPASLPILGVGLLGLFGLRLLRSRARG